MEDVTVKQCRINIVNDEKASSCIQSVNRNLFVPLEKSILDTSAGSF